MLFRSKQKTAYEISPRDWSSDVCSDLSQVWPTGSPPPSTAPISASSPMATLDELPLPVRIGATRTGGIDLNKPRIRAALAGTLALTAAPHGFTVAELTAKVRSMSGQGGYTSRQAAYDLRKLRGKGLAVKRARTRRYHIPPDAARTIAALLALRDHVLAPAPAVPAADANPRTGPRSTVTTRPSASACRPSSTIWASQR